MANDANSSIYGVQKINVDNVEVEILIIAKMPNALRATCTFLARKGWPTTVQGNLSKAIEEIATRRPDIVMISFNHPSPAIVKLPELIVQTFNTICVGFVELNDSTSNNKLTTRKIRYKIFGQPSGPNFFRGLGRILAERYDLKIDEAPEAKAGEAGGAKVRTLKPGESDPGPVLEKSGSKDSKKKEKAKVKGPDGTDVATEEEETGNVGVVGHLKSGTKGSTTIITGNARETSDSLSVPAGADQKRRTLKEIIGTDVSKDASGNMLFGQTLDPVPGAPVPVESIPEMSTTDLVSMLKKSLFGEGNEEHAEEATATDDLEKAVEKAFAKIIKKNPLAKPVRVKMISKVAVFPFDAAENSGYLVLALNGNPETLLKTIEGSLQATMNSMGIKGKIESGFMVTLPETDFDSWASTSAAFSFKMDNLGIEMGAAFFPTEKIPKAGAANDHGMLTVSLADVPVNEPVNFKAYIYLKENEKYYLYLRNGRQLQPEQKERLEGRSISEFFMKSVDMENLRAFFAGSFLRQTMRNSDDEAA